MDKDFVSTGSVAQDALRLGFMSTCYRGVAVLLGIDNLTSEACGAYKQSHAESIERFCNECSDKIITKQVKNFHEEDKYERDYNRYFERPGNFFIRLADCWAVPKKVARYKEILKTQPKRQYTVEAIIVGDTVLDFSDGTLNTKVQVTLKAHAWQGMLNGKHIEVKEELITTIHTISTKGVAYTVKYTPYTEYAEKYIPDEAVQAAADALAIGMTNLRVGMPGIKEREDKVQRDPVIVGYVGEQMFLIATFGYDPKNHMACNV